MVAALIYLTLSERNERKLILLILNELSESLFRLRIRDVVLPGWLVYKKRLRRDAVNTTDRNIIFFFRYHRPDDSPKSLT